MKTNYLLVHGAWQGAWAWQPIVALLRSQRINAYTLDLPGSGEDKTPAGEVTLDSYARAIVMKAKKIKEGKIILVGHSLGGAAVTAAASLAPELFSKIIYLCAFLPQDGESVSQLEKESKKKGTIGPIVALDADGASVDLIEERIAEILFNDCDAGQIQPLLPLFRSQPLNPMLAAASWSKGFESIPKEYILCRQDQAISPLLQQQMADHAGIASCHILNCGHEPFFSIPNQLADLLVALNNR